MPGTDVSQRTLADPRRLAALDATALLDTPSEMAFDRLTALAASVLNVPVALVSLVTDDRQFFASQCGLPSPVAEERETPLSHSFCQHVVNDAAPLIVADARDVPRLASNLAIPELGVIAYAGFPLIDADGQVLGSFCAIDVVPRDWTEADLAVLATLADATMGIVALRAEAVAMLAMQERLQAGLVPELPAFTGADAAAIYRPGDRHMLVGGDFYVGSELLDGTICVLIGDVVGHGPEAAAFAASLRSAWRALLLTPDSLPDLMERLNRVALDEARPSSGYATALAYTISPDGRTLTACAAGHPPPLVLGADGVHELAVRPGPPLATVEAGRRVYAAAEHELAPGDSVFVYTDGLTEGRRHPGTRERLGVARLATELATLHASGAAPATILAAAVDVAIRANGQPLPDDVAAVLVRPR